MRTFGKIVVVLGLVLVLGMPVFAQDVKSASATLGITGTMKYITAVSLKNTTSSFDLYSVSGYVALTTLTAICNSPLGYAIKISSANEGYVSMDTDNKVKYSLKIDSTVLNPTSTAAIIAEAGSKTAKAGTDSNLLIQFENAGTDFIAAGSYTDTLTISVVAK